MTLERLKELLQQATPGPCVGSGAEILPSGDLRYYIGFPGIKTGSVAGSIALGEAINALPALIEVAEMAKVVKETYSAVMSDPVASDIDAEFGCLADAWNRLDAALAKLEGGNANAEGD